MWNDSNHYSRTPIVSFSDQEWIDVVCKHKGRSTNGLYHVGQNKNEMGREVLQNFEEQMILGLDRSLSNGLVSENDPHPPEFESNEMEATLSQGKVNFIGGEDVVPETPVVVDGRLGRQSIGDILYSKSLRQDESDGFCERDPDRKDDTFGKLDFVEATKAWGWVSLVASGLQMMRRLYYLNLRHEKSQQGDIT